MVAFTDGALQIMRRALAGGDVEFSGRANAGISLGRLAEMLDVSPSNVTGLVDSLESAGLVERVPDPHDRAPSRQGSPNPAGRGFDAIREPALRSLSPLAEGFTTDELVQLRHLSLKLLANALKLAKD